MRRAIFPASCAFLAALSAACADAPPPTPMLVRDSAGVRIVEYAGEPEPARSLRLSPDPVYRHGNRPGDHLFARVQSGALRGDGAAVVVDAGTQAGAGQQVLLFDPGGSLRAVLAGPGQGPGEVRQVQSVTVLGDDEVLLADRGNARLMVFADTVLVRSVSLLGSPEVARGLRVLGVDGEGRPLMATASYQSDFTVPWLPGQLARLDVETLRADTVASYDMAARAPREGPRNPFQPFGIVAAAGGRFVHLRTDVAELVWRASDGEVRQILRWNPEPVPATDALLEPYRAALREDLIRVNPDRSEADLEPFLAQTLANIAIPPGTVLPITQTLRGDGEGRVWISEFVPAASALNFFPPRYHVIDADGTWLGSVEMPPRFRLLDVSGGRVLGVQIDELDVESVVVHELMAQPGGGLADLDRGPDGLRRVVRSPEPTSVGAVQEAKGGSSPGCS